MHVLVIDVGGTNVKVLATGQSQRRKFPSGPELTPEGMVEKVKATTKDWDYDVVFHRISGASGYGTPCCGASKLSQGVDWV